MHARAIFPYGTLLPLQQGLRTQAAIDANDLSKDDLAKLVVTVNGEVLPPSRFTIESLATDEAGHIVVEMTLDGVTPGPDTHITVGLANRRIVLQSIGATSQGTVVLSTETTAAAILRRALNDQGQTDAPVTPKAIERLSALLTTAFLSTATGDPTATHAFRYAVSQLTGALAAGGAEPVVATVPIVPPASGGGGGGGGVTAPVGETVQPLKDIVFVSNRTGTNKLYTASLTGGDEVEVTGKPGTEAGAVWTPDGSKLVFVSNRTGNNDIWIVNADGTGLRNLTNGNGTNVSPQISPNGTKIAFLSNSDSTDPAKYDVCVMNLDGTGLVNLTNHPAHDNQAAWSPDSTKIVFTSDRTGNSDLFVIGVDGTGLQQLTNDPAGDTSASWSPAGRIGGELIAFSRRTTSSDGKIWVMNPDGSNQRRATTDLLDESMVNTQDVWSPDGSELIFVRSVGGVAVDFVRINPDDPNSEVTILSDGNYNRQPTWVNAGTLLFQSLSGMVWGINSLTLSDSTVTPLFFGTGYSNTGQAPRPGL